MDAKAIKIVVYHCRNLQMFKNGQQKTYERSRPGVTFVALPCSGKVEAHHLLKTLAGGACGVLVCACAEAACQYLEGSMRAHKRVSYAHSWLRQIGMEPERLQFVHLPPMDGDALDEALNAFTARLESFGNVSPVAKIQAG